MSKSKEAREALIKKVTNDIQSSKFTQELGSKALVERSKFREEDGSMEQLREVLSDIGRNLQETGAVPSAAEYVGSLSVHVYVIPSLASAMFATVNAPGEMPAELADGALRELTGSTMETFGKKRQTLRSGF